MAKKQPPGGDEAALWKAVTKDVKPIERKAKRAVATPPPKPEKPLKTGVTAKKTKPVTVKPAGAMAPTPPPPPSPSELSHGRASGVDKRTLDRLRRGQMAVEAEIDLHGHTQDEASRALQAFIAGQAGAGRRCVRVVTGKGSFREGGGVLKAAVPRWLNESPLRDMILAFSHARRDDGGEGALYVLLRRKRPKPVPGG